jgi:C_GCAxxG_C_C family probable redox protein
MAQFVPRLARGAAACAAGSIVYSPARMSSVEKAVELFRGGCACSQAVLATYGPRYGLAEDQALRVAAAFAGGMRMGETCGAVTGALMVLGLAHCTNECRKAEGRTGAYAAVAAFAETFKTRNGSLSCRELLGCDVSTPAGNQAAREKGLFTTICPRLVRDASEILEATLPKP